MKASKTILENSEYKDFIYGIGNKESPLFVWSTALLLILFIISIVLYNTIDIFNLRPINQVICYSNYEKQNVELIDIIKTEYKKRKIEYDYSAQIRKEDIDIEATIIIDEIKKYDDSWNIITSNIYYPIILTDDGNNGKGFSIWVDEIKDIDKYTTGDKVKIKGKINGINSDWIIINEGEILQ